MTKSAAPASSKQTPISVEYVAPDALKAADYNPRQISEAELAKLTASMAAFGVVDPIIARRKDGLVVGGHQRLAAARQLGLEAVPVVYLDKLTDKQAKVLNLALNRISGEWDLPRLGALLDGLGELDLGLSGFDMPEISRALTSWRNEQGGLTDPDAVPEAPAEPISKLGDLWLLGEHRLLCGDSTDAEAVSRLLDGEKAALLWADPPYGIDYVPNYGNSNRAYKNDRIIGDRSIDGSWLPLFATPRTYLCTRWDVYPTWFAMLGNVRNVIVWDKGQGAAGNLKSYAPRHEFIIFSAEESGDLFSEGRQDNVWAIPGFAQFTARRAEDSWGEHSTQKPSALVERAIVDSSHAGDIVVDPFLGSGTSLIAAERAGRRCYAMEIEPRYVDVAVRRWEAYTGREATRDG